MSGADGDDAAVVGTKVLKFFAGVKHFGEVIGVVRPDVDEPDGED